MAVDLRLLDASRIDRALARRGLAPFVRAAWHQVDTSPLVWGWHMDAVCEHLEAVTRREIRDLVINMPPGLSKSLTVSVLWPAWAWTHQPDHRWIATSYADTVALRDARKHRSLVASEWYQARWPGVRIPPTREASVAMGQWSTTAGGSRYTTTVRGQLTGQHCDTLIVDDPIDPQGAGSASGAELDDVLRWWREVVPTRFRDPPTSARVLVMQRLHERDLAAEMTRAGATVLCLPMRYEREHPHRYARDPRTEDGQLLCPQRMPEASVRRMEAAMGPAAVAAQLQQRPSPAGGGVFRTEWLARRWVELPPGGTWSQSWDLAFKETADSSYVVGQVWYAHGSNYYLVDQTRERLDFARTLDAIKSLTGRYPRAHTKLVEDKANGPAVVSALRRDVPGLQLVTPEGGKIARANAVQGLFAAGNVLLPDPERAVYPDGRRGAPWLADYAHELATFPNGANDDQVDATTQYLNHAAGSWARRFVDAMERV